MTTVTDILDTHGHPVVDIVIDAETRDLIAWTAAEAFELLTCVYDVTDVMVLASGTVKWPDGSAGVFTTTAIDATWKAINSYTVTHTASGKIVTQALVTRNANGLIVTKPELTVA